MWSCVVLTFMQFEMEDQTEGTEESTDPVAPGTSYCGPAGFDCLSIDAVTDLVSF